MHLFANMLCPANVQRLQHMHREYLCIILSVEILQCHFSRPDGRRSKRSVILIYKLRN